MKLMSVYAPQQLFPPLDRFPPMPRYFFHTHNGVTVLDVRGLEFPNFRVARDEAIRTCGEMLRQIPFFINNGDPFQLWVTDQPGGKGKKLLTLTVSAENG
jgi:hypothetical protein